LFLVAVVAACNTSSTTSVVDDVEERVDELLSQMTLEEKVAQMAGNGSIALPEGGVLWSAPGVERLGVPPFRMSDGPRGVTAALGGTTFPVGMARGATWEPDVERRIGAAMGRELRAIGGNVLLAPTINNLRHPSWGRSQETYGEDVGRVRSGSAGTRACESETLRGQQHRGHPVRRRRNGR
jgi:beta-glucosidase